MKAPLRSRVAILITAVVFLAAGANHFRHGSFYVRIIPPMFPHPWALVWISGFFEMLGGAGLLIRPLRHSAAWGLILLLIAVFPANLYMALYPDRFADLHFPLWGLWLRLPLQAIMIGWIGWIAVRTYPETTPTAR